MTSTIKQEIGMEIKQWQKLQNWKLRVNDLDGPVYFAFLIS